MTDRDSWVLVLPEDDGYEIAIGTEYVSSTKQGRTTEWPNVILTLCGNDGLKRLQTSLNRGAPVDMEHTGLVMGDTLPAGLWTVKEFETVAQCIGLVEALRAETACGRRNVTETLESYLSMVDEIMAVGVALSVQIKGTL